MVCGLGIPASSRPFQAGRGSIAIGNDDSMTEIQAQPSAPPDAPLPRKSFLGRTKDRLAALSRTKHAHAAMLAVCVADGSILPVPPFTILIPMVLAERRRWAFFATTGTIASLLGGLIGYAMGHWGGLAVTNWFGIDLDLVLLFPQLGIDTTLRAALTEHFWLLALLCSVLPTPYKVVALGSGVLGVGFPEFVLASVIGRTVRMFGVAGAFAFFGERASRWIRF